MQIVMSGGHIQSAITRYGNEVCNTSQISAGHQGQLHRRSDNSQILKLARQPLNKMAESFNPEPLVDVSCVGDAGEMLYVKDSIMTPGLL